MNEFWKLIIRNCRLGPYEKSLLKKFNELIEYDILYSYCSSR